MRKYTSKHEEHLSQPFQTKNKRFKIAVTFLTGFNGIFKVTNSNSRFCFKKSITDGDDFIQIIIPTGAHEIEYLDDEIKRFIIDEGHFTEAISPFTIKPSFTTLGSIFENVPQGPIISFVFDDIFEIFWDFVKLYYIKNIIYHVVELILCHSITFFSNVILLKR